MRIPDCSLNVIKLTICTEAERAGIFHTLLKALVEAKQVRLLIVYEMRGARGG
jgi:hypothetical protein